MTSKPEGPGPDTSRPADPPSQKRPHATLDLKATEVKSGEAAAMRKEEAKSGSTAEASAGKTPESMPSPAAPAAGPKPQDATKPAAATSTKAPPPTPHRSNSGGRTFSHLVASIAGGVIALAGAYWLGQSSNGPNTASISDEMSALEKRLEALEQSSGAPVSDPAVADKLEQAATRLAKLEALSATVDELTAAQGRLAAETKGLGEKLGQSPVSEAAADRITRLEDQLTTLTTAAGADGDKGGRIPQLAVITGRIADLESKVDNQIAAMRKSIPDEVAARLGTVAETTEAARTGVQRADRELQAVKTDVVRLGQRAEALKADNDRITQTIEVLKEDQGRHSSAFDGFKSNVESQLKSVARPADVASAVAPVAGKLESLEGNLASVVKSEQDRKTDAERIVISLELANLKRALDSGQGYAAELAAVRKASGGKIDLSALDRYQSGGLPATAELEREFHTLAYTIVEADSEPAEAGIVDKLIAGAKSVVRVRKVNHNPDDKSAEAVVARMEKALQDGRLDEALQQAKDIPAKAVGRASEWLAKAEARHAVDRAIATIEGQLKKSLSGAAAGVSTQPPSSGSN